MNRNKLPTIFQVLISVLLCLCFWRCSGSQTGNSGGDIGAPVEKNTQGAGGTIEAHSINQQIAEGKLTMLMRGLYINDMGVPKNQELAGDPLTYSGELNLKLILEKHPYLPTADAQRILLLNFGNISQLKYPILLKDPIPEGADSNLSYTKLSELVCDDVKGTEFCQNLHRIFVKVEGNVDTDFKGKTTLPSKAEDQLLGAFLTPEDGLTDDGDFLDFRSIQNQATYKAFLDFPFLGFFILKGHGYPAPVPLNPNIPVVHF